MAKFIFLLRKYCVFIALMIISYSLAMLVPQSWLTENEWTLKYAISLGKVFPPVAAYIAKSSFPNITALYFLIMWSLSPLFFIWYLRFLKRSAEFGTPASTLKLVLLGIPILLFLYGCVFFALYVNPGYDFNLMPINHSRVALGIFGWFFAGGGASVVLAFCVLLTTRLVSILKQRLFSKGE